MSRVNLTDALSTKAAETPATPQNAAQRPRKKKAAPKPATARKTPQKAAQQAAQGAQDEQPSARSSREPVVLAIDTDDAKRVSLYLHPDDYEWIKYDLRGGDLQAVFRSLIAVARADDRLATKVARLSRTAPRGGK